MRKGQLATEYLGTYIWTAVALLAVFGTLTYFGAFDSTNYLTEHCESGAQIVCKEVTYNHFGTLQLAVSNQLTKDIVIKEFTVLEEGSYEPDLVIKSGHTGVVTLTGLQELGVGVKKDFSFEIIYQRNETDARNHTIAGSSVVETQLSTVVCDDDTHDRMCSTTKPLFCSDGELVDNCKVCGCPPHISQCHADGVCRNTIKPGGGGLGGLGS